MLMRVRRVAVYGPAYLDRVLRVACPLIDDAGAPPLDQSVEGEWEFAGGDTLVLRSPDGFMLEIAPPADWSGPRGSVRLHHPIRPGLWGRRTVPAIGWLDDLGGMGAGFAAALGGLLHSALGSEDDATSRSISERLARHGVVHRSIRVDSRTADWTLLVTSGEFGDKLPVGFRGCHDALAPDEWLRRGVDPCDLRVVAGLPNRLAEPLLAAEGAVTRFFAPAMRNMIDRDHPLHGLVDRVDVLCCNRAEWLALDDPVEVASRVPIVAVTDGPRGIDLRFANREGGFTETHIAAFPRVRPPRDTNRAGEAFAATFVAALLDHGWDGRRRFVDEDLARGAAERGAAAAALVLDRLEFGFPRPDEIEAAQRAGVVA
jgi:ribokinase